MRKLALFAVVVFFSAATAKAVPEGTYYPTQEYENYGTLTVIAVEDGEGEMMPKVIIDESIGIPPNPYWTEYSPEDEEEWSGQLDLQDGSTLPDHYYLNYLKDGVEFLDYRLSAGWGVTGYQGPLTGIYFGPAFQTVETNTWTLWIAVWSGQYIWIPVPPYWVPESILIWEGVLGPDPPPEDEYELVFLQEPEDPSKDTEFDPTLETALIETSTGNPVQGADSKVYIHLYEYEEQGTPAFLFPEDDTNRYMDGGVVLWTGLGIVASEGYYHIRASTQYEGEEYIAWSEVFWCDNFPDIVNINIVDQEGNYIDIEDFFADARSLFGDAGDFYDLVTLAILSEEQESYLELLWDLIEEHFAFVDGQGLQYVFGDAFMGAFFEDDQYGSRPWLELIESNTMAMFSTMIHLAHPEYTDYYEDGIFYKIKQELKGSLNVEHEQVDYSLAELLLAQKLASESLVQLLGEGGDFYDFLLELEFSLDGELEVELNFDEVFGEIMNSILEELGHIKGQVEPGGQLYSLLEAVQSDTGDMLDHLDALAGSMGPGGVMYEMLYGILQSIDSQLSHLDTLGDIKTLLEDIKSEAEDIAEWLEDIENLMHAEVDGVRIPGFQALSDRLADIEDALWVEHEGGQAPGMEVIVELLRADAEELAEPEDLGEIEQQIAGDLGDMEDDIDEIDSALPEAYPEDGGELGVEDQAVYDGAIEKIDSTSGGVDVLDTAHESARSGLLGWITGERDHWLGLVSIPSLGTANYVNLSVPPALSNNMFGEDRTAEVEIDLSGWVVGFVRQLQLYVLLFVSAFGFYKIVIWGFG